MELSSAYVHIDRGVTQASAAPAVQGAPNPPGGPQPFKGAPIEAKPNEYRSDMGDNGAPSAHFAGGPIILPYTTFCGLNKNLQGLTACLLLTIGWLYSHSHLLAS